MIARQLTPTLLKALSDTPVVLLCGARQTGKSTLVQSLTAGEFPASYVSLDDPGMLAAALIDPQGFLRGQRYPLVLDEVQLAPQLFRAIKLMVDRNRRPGRFLLTGSANVMLMPQLSDSLAGRMQVLTLWPLSQGELTRQGESFVDRVFRKGFASLSQAASLLDSRAFLRIVLSGGFPEVVLRRNLGRRRAWFEAYVSTMLQRDIRDFAEIEGRAQLPRLLAMLAAQAMSLVNISELSRGTGIAQTTLKRYLSLLEATYLVQPLPAWSGSIRKRLIRTPKIMFIDTGLLSHLLDVDMARLRRHPQWSGPLIENFVGQELCKQLTWSRTNARLYYYRAADGREVDFVLEGGGGRIVGIEVKASATLGGQDVKGMVDLAQTTGERFHRGIILYGGSEVIPFAKNIHALPIFTLWQSRD